MRAWILSLSLGLLSAGAQASLLKTDCNLDKALKNEAVNATLGVKGNCDTSKLVKQEKEKVKAEVQKGRTDLLGEKRADLKESGNGMQQKMDKANQQLHKAEQDAKTIARDPLKAAATAVLDKQ
ncbi:hypothetical protein GL264_13160 [Aeromonas jandaei]|jgi:hypothetical protein|uniref:DUF1090 domain-containing protein n=3 Tax=Aeromonadaceae TaxID=84642 RepID=A0ABY3MHM9_AERVE|nr:hypothetical protein [Aeromonas allosaccharophila]ANB70816.1 hypothetical protein A6033_17885 [Aeromonas veronii]KIQ79324.1 hypothetical protein RW26_15605 [Aeromonas sp. L_1B5_3]MBL0626000.1 hypothetical protein [Aeromonas jandaei]QXC40279.1 hypothetical protein I6L40_08615 [Aeromonas sp. FDAARGOS 1410]RRA90782.1 hypothetical protein AVS_15185 [Aeromonas veronii bv. sobria]